MIQLVSTRGKNQIKFADILKLVPYVEEIKIGTFDKEEREAAVKEAKTEIANEMFKNTKKTEKENARILDQQIKKRTSKEKEKRIVSLYETDAQTRKRVVETSLILLTKCELFKDFGDIYDLYKKDGNFKSLQYEKEYQLNPIVVTLFIMIMTTYQYWADGKIDERINLKLEEKNAQKEEIVGSVLKNLQHYYEESDTDKSSKDLRREFLGDDFQNLLIRFYNYLEEQCTIENYVKNIDSDIDDGAAQVYFKFYCENFDEINRNKFNKTQREVMLEDSEFDTVAIQALAEVYAEQGKIHVDQGEYVNTALIFTYLKMSSTLQMVNGNKNIDPTDKTNNQEAMKLKKDLYEKWISQIVRPSVDLDARRKGNSERISKIQDMIKHDREYLQEKYGELDNPETHMYSGIEFDMKNKVMEVNDNDFQERKGDVPELRVYEEELGKLLDKFIQSLNKLKK